MPCEIESDFVCIDTIDALQKSGISDKVAVLHGDLCNEPLMPKNFEFYNPDEHKQIIALLEEKKPTAIITVNPHKEHIIQDGDFSIPCAVVDVDTLDIFLQNADKKVKMTINTKRVPTKAHNIIATYGESLEKICFSAHIDTKPTTPGALDNASGVSVLLAFAESLSGKECSHQIEIVLLNGEDYYTTPGETIYMRSLTPEYKMAINVDGVGLKDSATSISFYECPQEIEDMIVKRAEEMTGIEKIEPWPMGDHMIFAYNQIPSIAITASNIFSLLDTITHSPDDNMNNLDLDILNNAVCFLIGCAEQYTN
jgi:aminopeptidase YwaD